ncbi:MAG: carboxypeptidase-like regulatory domain-containing protein, partial [Vicinamibacterales bacterium]|nr:carboxypeptidase-like regulatory domain-containing protein [Vicinamibacterales bacterium]
MLSVTQYLPGDVIRCGEATWFAGRVVAVLFSEEVTRASVQDGLVRGQITAFRPEANEAVGVALQPGRRIAFVAMRDAIGPFVPRSMTIEGVSDASGNVVAAVTVPMQSTIEQEEEGGQVFGRVLYGDGTPAVGVDARLFALLGGCTVGISAKPTDGEGRFAWDFLLKDIYASRIVAVDPRTGDSRGLNFALQRNGQRLEVNVVFLGRGTVSGRALSETGQPLPGTSIRITSLTDRSQYGATADDAGAFSVAGVPVGNLLIEAVYIRRNAQGHPEGGAEVTVSEFIPAAGGIVSRDLVLIDDTRRPPTITFGSITGAVLRGDGTTPAQNVPVIAYYRANSQPGIGCPAQPDGGGSLNECALAVANTDTNGRFAFEKLPSGQFRVETFDQTTYQQGEARAVVPANGTAAV